MHPSLKYLVFVLFFYPMTGYTTSSDPATIPAFAGDTLRADALYPYGRTLSGKGPDGSMRVELISSAAHVGFCFSGRECLVYASVKEGSGHNYLQYELDGVYQPQKIKISANDPKPVHITAPGGGKHIVWIYKATEATTGPVYIQKIAGKGLWALRNSDAPLIEFIGNSITCGAQADPSETPCNVGEYHDHHNAYYAYGPRVARALRANYMVSSVSGIGIYRTWNTNGPAMPQVYEKAGLQEQDLRVWDFASYQPRIVSIALGTNDLSNGDGEHERQPFDSAVFVNAYIKFVQLVKSKYPSAQIALLSSPMVGGDRRVLLQNCLTAVKAGIDTLYPSGKRVALYFFEPMKARGCGGHPSVEDHGILAEQLLPFFRDLL